MATSAQIKEQLASLQQQLASANASLQTAAASLLGWWNPFSEISSSYRSSLAQEAEQHLKEIARLSNELPLGARPVISDEELVGWEPEEAAELPRSLPFGCYRHSGNPTAMMPAAVPFIGNYQAVVLGCNDEGAEQCRAMFLSMILRTALLLPQRVRYCLIDPANAGNAFIAVAGALAHRAKPEGDVVADLRKIQEGFQRIQVNFLNPQTDAFEKLDAETQATEKLQLVFVADFPRGFDRRSIELLHSVAENGPRNGTYVIVEWNTSHKLPPGMEFKDLNFQGASIVDLRKLGDEGDEHFALGTDELPGADSIAAALRRVREMARDDVGVIPFSDPRMLPPPDKWWQESATECIHVPVGLRGAHQTIDVWFGARQQTNCAHGIVAGTTGSGKSIFLHVLIGGLAARYSPEELNFYLIDMKEGVELATYRHLPHTSVISSNSSPELGRSILGELCAELDRRYELFQARGLTEFSEYRTTENAEKMPRILLVVDEYQGLFKQDREGLGSRLLLRLAEQGRAAGIHVLLASQKFEAAGMEHADAIFNNIGLKLSLMLAPDQIDRQQMFTSSAERSLLRQCDVAGKLVLRSPDLAQTVTGRVAFADRVFRNQHLDGLAGKARDGGLGLKSPAVLDGKAEPEFDDAPFIEALANDPSPVLDEEALTVLVKSREGGISEASWLAEDHPIAFVLGKDFSVRGYASFVFRRRSGENALLVSSGHEPERYGMAVAIVCSAILQRRAELQLEIMDFSQPTTRWHGAIAQTAQELGQKYGAEINVLTDRREAEVWLDRLCTELDRRKGLSDLELASEKSVIVVVTEPDRVQALQRQGVGLSSVDSPAGAKLRKIYQEGPLLGMHVVISAGSAAGLWQVIDRRTVELFRHRICLQIDEKASYDLLGSARAANLNRDHPKPVRALVYDQQRNAESVFKPYVCHGDDQGIVPSIKRLFGAEQAALQS
jgi:S-DNA-T family DNA segregation ATPase FtsK/SpoIIIE